MCLGSSGSWERDSIRGTNQSQKTGAEKPKHNSSPAREVCSSVCVEGSCTIVGMGEQEVTMEVNDENQEQELNLRI